MIELLKFYRNSCAPCGIITPIINKLATKYPNVRFVSIDDDELYEESQKYGVKYVPTIIILKEGIEIFRVVGIKSDIEKTIEDQILKNI